MWSRSEIDWTGVETMSSDVYLQRSTNRPISLQKSSAAPLLKYGVLLNFDDYVSQILIVTCTTCYGVGHIPLNYIRILNVVILVVHIINQPTILAYLYTSAFS